MIGKCGKIPWNLSTERNRFKQICSGKKIIMGRKSFDEIGHALPYCTIIIVSKTLKTAPEKCLLAQNLKQAFSFYDKNEELNLTSSDNEIFESIFGFLPKEFSNPNSYTSAFLVNVMETSERFERVKVYPIYGTNNFDVELDEVLKKVTE